MTVSDHAPPGDLPEARLSDAVGRSDAAHSSDTPPSGSPPRSWLERGLTGVGLLALLASALFGGNAFRMRERFLGSETPEPAPAAVSRAADAPAPVTVEPQRTVLRSQPWWQDVTRLDGVGPTTTPTFTIVDDAVQWRAEWSCDTGRLVVRAPGRPRPLVEAACPGPGTGFASKPGAMSLEVQAEGPWRLEVEQQVDVPLDEPPLPAMAAPGAVAVATGSFYRIDQVGTGTVTVYRLADGTYALRFDDFFVTANRDLEIQFSPLEVPTSTEQVSEGRSRTVAALDVTAGSLNFTVPPGEDPTRYKSVVIWCQRLFSAYSAATLRPV